MKKYIRTTASVYLIFSVGFLFWWMLASKEKSTVIEDYLFKTKAKPDYFHSVSRPVSTSSRTTLKRVLSWRWKDTNEDRYLKDFTKGESFCEGNFIGYDGKFAQLTNVIIDPSKGKGRRGGENISEVLNQSEDEEYYTLKSGYFKLNCKKDINYTFHTRSHVSQWLKVLNTTSEHQPYKIKHRSWTIAVKRYEYVNLYHTMTDFYNAFLVSKAFKMQPGNITLLWIDGHPSGTLDKTWETLFGTILRAGNIQQPSMFSHMIWGIMGYDSPLNNHISNKVPYVEEFRSFFLSRHGIPPKSELKCAKLKIMFLWRRDYVAHPRNPSGSVSRKIKNEDELLKSAKEKFSSHDVFGIQIDKLKMEKQLELIANTDILIGMHGAGLSHTLFLPKHAGLIELYPTYWSNANIHFKAMARWKSLHYLNWINIDQTKELPNHFTIVDVDVVTDLIAKMKHNICP